MVLYTSLADLVPDYVLEKHTDKYKLTESAAIISILEYLQLEASALVYVFLFTSIAVLD